MNIFYRGYLIHENIRSICYTIYGRRPSRHELDTLGSVIEAMQWVDQDLAAGTRTSWSRTAQPALL